MGDGRGGHSHFQIGGTRDHHMALHFVVAKHRGPVGRELRLENVIVRRDRQTLTQQRMKGGIAVSKPYEPCWAANSAVWIQKRRLWNG